MPACGFAALLPLPPPLLLPHPAKMPLPPASGESDLLILWFRNDLRIHDNQILQHRELLHVKTRVVAVYCIDPRAVHHTPSPPRDCTGGGAHGQRWLDFESGTWLGNVLHEDDTPEDTTLPIPRCGPHRAQFLAETLISLRRDLRVKLGIPLVLVKDEPEHAIPKLAAALASDFMRSTNSDRPPRLALSYMGEDTPEEVEVQERVASGLRASVVDVQCAIEFRVHRTHTLYHADDILESGGCDLGTKLPFPFGKFLQTVKAVPVRPVLQLQPIPGQTNKERLVWMRRGGALDDMVQSAGLTQLAGDDAVYTSVGLTRPHRAGANGRGSGSDAAKDAPACSFMWRGGESHALERLNEYVRVSSDGDKVWGGLWNYHQTRNMLDGSESSSRLSPWLANGSLSVRSVYWRVKDAQKLRERLHGRSRAGQAAGQKGLDHVYKFWFELCWRDYFRFYCAHFGSKVFWLGGPSRMDRKRDKLMPWLNPWSYSSRGDIGDAASRDWHARERLRAVVKAWAVGTTGQPLVDACMQHLLATGYLSNRGRYIVASFLTHYLGIDWRIGAEWFEYVLLDHDVCSNYGEWSSMAGVARHPSVPTPLGVKGRGPSAGRNKGRRRGRADAKADSAAARAGMPWAAGAASSGLSVFDPVQQSLQYDRRGEYRARWAKPMGGIAGAAVHGKKQATNSGEDHPTAWSQVGSFEPFEFERNVATVLAHMCVSKDPIAKVIPTGSTSQIRGSGPQQKPALSQPRQLQPTLATPSEAGATGGRPSQSRRRRRRHGRSRVQDGRV